MSAFAEMAVERRPVRMAYAKCVMCGMRGFVVLELLIAPSG